MNLPLSNSWKNDLLSESFLSDQLSRVEIWGGFSTKEYSKRGIKGYDSKYLTLMYSANTTVAGSSHSRSSAFLTSSDHNVARVLSATSPIVYNRSLAQKSSRVKTTQPRDNKKWIIIVPVAEDIERRWRASVSFELAPDTDSHPTLFIKHHQEMLNSLANNLYKMWLLFEGRTFNLYKARSTFCFNAIQIANLLAEGCSTKIMADKLHISRSGVEYHIESMRQVLGASNRGNLIAELFRKGIIT